MVKVTEKTRDRIKRLAAQEGKSMQSFLDDMLEDYEERQFFAELSEGYERLRGDKKAWADHQGELAEWDDVLADGLADEES